MPSEMRTRRKKASQISLYMAALVFACLLIAPSSPADAQTAERVDAIAAYPVQGVHAPEPTAAALSGMGLAGVGWYVGRFRMRRRFRQDLLASAAGDGAVIVAPGLSFAEWLNSQAYLGCKRCMDMAVATVALLLLTPLFAVIAIAIYIDSPGPIFYRQKRLGEGRRTFHLCKFRSMCTNADEILQRDENLRKEFEALYKLKDDPRITRVGAFLRKTSLDELPQLLNVVMGDITLVGPRPIVEKEVEKYWPFEERLFSVRPGVTGLWQVSGRNDTSYEERVRLDMKYIAERNLLLDSRILLGTLPVLLKRDNGAY